MYFDEHPECKEYNKSFPVVKDKKPVVCHPRLTPVHRHTDTSFIPDEIMQQTMKCYEQNNLFLYLANHLGYESALRLMKTYHAKARTHKVQDPKFRKFKEKCGPRLQMKVNCLEEKLD